MNIGQLELPAVYIVTLTTLLWGAVVFYRNRKSESNQLFFLLCLSFVLWAVVNHFSLNPPPFGDKLFWVRLVLYTAAPQGVMFALFIHTFPQKKITLPKRYTSLLLVALVLQMSLTLTPYVFERIVVVGTSTVPIVGPGIFYYASILVLSFGLGIYWLIHKTILAKDDARRALAIILIGFFTTIVLLLVFLLFAVAIFGNTTFIPLSPLFILPFISSSAYALVRGKFLNMRLIATELLVGILGIALFVDALLSGSWVTIVWKGFFCCAIGLLGLLLSKSVYKEVERREEVTALAQSLEQANTRLQELDRQKTDFLSIAAHQLRTPLSIINGYLELIKDGAYGKVTQGTKDILKNMDESNGHLVKLVDEFLDITRIEQGRTKYDFKPVNICKIIDSIVHELKDRATQRGLKLMWDAGECSTDQAMVDEEKIHHVVFNFIDNAIKYTDKGSIMVRAEDQDDGITVRIIDTGFGFDKADEANFFQKFYRGKNVIGTNVNGTGLGLYVCRKFIDGHQGRIWAHSPGLGKGSEFGFWVPTVQSAQTPAPAATTSVPIFPSA